MAALDSPFEIRLTKASKEYCLDNYLQEDEQKTINLEKKPVKTKNEANKNENDDQKHIISSYYQNKYIKFPFIVIEVIDKAVNFSYFL